MKSICYLLAVTIAAWFAGIDEAMAEQPNIVILYSDDAGYADFGFQDITDRAMRGLTPNIDSIAREGARFTSAYMSGAVCSPSRAGMLCGRYQERFGHELNIPPGFMKGGMPLKEKTFADRLKTQGYRTGIIGKWHLGYPAEYHPNKRGFDHFYGLLQGSRGYFAAKKISPHRVIQLNGQPTPETGYVTDRFGDGAIDFIERNKDKPFFLYVSFTAPHGPLQAKEEHLAKLMHIEEKRRRTYVGMIQSLDENVGRILESLKRHGLEQNTLVIFTNDNGGQTSTGAINTPLRGRKGKIWEGGIRVPMAIKWPGKIKPGLVVDEPVISLDFTPTFLAACGAEVDPAWELDGINLLPRLTGQVAAIPDRPLYWRIHGPEKESAVRLGNWKLVQYDHDAATKPQLYNLKSDISESRDVANGNPEQVRKLGELLSTWESELMNPLWSYGKKRRKKGRGEAKRDPTRKQDKSF